MLPRILIATILLAAAGCADLPRTYEPGPVDAAYALPLPNGCERGTC